MSNSVGSRIKNRRIELGLSVDEVARRLGKDRTTVYRYESDYIKNLPLTVLEPLAEVLQTTPGAFLVDVDTRQNSEDDTVRRLLKYMTLLNPAGQAEALSRIEELTELSKFRKG